MLKFSRLRVEEAIRDLGELYELMDTHVAEGLKKAVVSCTRGCSSCCYMFVTITRLEAFYIAYHILTTDQLSGLDTLLVRLREQALQVVDARIDSFFHLRKKTPCVFLNTNKGECNIYSVRPVACRSLYVQSNPENCKPENAGADVEIVDPGITPAIHEFEEQRLEGISVRVALPLGVLWGLRELGLSIIIQSKRERQMAEKLIYACRGLPTPEEWQHAYEQYLRGNSEERMRFIKRPIPMKGKDD
jgi:Fe-S-cluster containining protein